jgi:hypothetical protein
MGCEKMGWVAAAGLACALGVPSAGASPAAGEATRMSGKYIQRTDAQSMERMGGQGCFFPDPGSQAWFTRAAGDKRDAWFCFVNQKEAAKAFGLVEGGKGPGCGWGGVARVEIDSLSRAPQDTDAHGAARLRSVGWASKAKVIPCDPAIAKALKK